MSWGPEESLGLFLSYILSWCILTSRAWSSAWDTKRETPPHLCLCERRGEISLESAALWFSFLWEGLINIHSQQLPSYRRLFRWFQQYLTRSLLFFLFPHFSPLFFAVLLQLSSKVQQERWLLAWDNRVLGVQSSTKEKEPELLIPRGRDFLGIAGAHRERQRHHELFAFLFNCFSLVLSPSCHIGSEQAERQGLVAASPTQGRAPERGNFHQGWSRVRKAPAFQNLSPRKAESKLLWTRREGVVRGKSRAARNEGRGCLSWKQPWRSLRAEMAVIIDSREGRCQGQGMSSRNNNEDA